MDAALWQHGMNHRCYRKVRNVYNVNLSKGFEKNVRALSSKTKVLFHNGPTCHRFNPRTENVTYEIC